jgi:hypothetical protein
MPCSAERSAGRFVAFAVAVSAAAMFAVSCSSSENQVGRTTTIAASAPTRLTVAACVRRWNRNGYGSILDSYDPTLNRVPVDVVDLTARSCMYALYLTSMGGSDQWLQIIATDDMSAADVQNFGTTITNGAPAGALSSPRIRLVNGHLHRGS